MNPFQHSKAAGEIYKEIYLAADDLNILSQNGQGILACRIAEMLARLFDLKLGAPE